MDFISSNKKNGRGKGIVKVSNLFEKYKKILKAPQGSIISAFISAVYEVLGIRITNEQCTYTVHTKIIKTHLSGIIKSEINLHKEQILSKMAEELGKKNTPTEIL